MQKRKGTFISLIAFMTFILFVSGQLFTAQVARDKITETMTFSTGHVNQLMEAKTKKGIYEENIQKELNYTHNNIAYEIGVDGGKLDWENNIPTEDEIRSELLNQFFEHEYNINDQNRLIGCSKPLIDEDNLSIEGEHLIKLDFSGAWMKCHGLNSTAMLPIEKEFEIENSRNNYLPMAFYGIVLSEEVSNIVPDNAEGQATITTTCLPDSSTGRAQAKTRAESEAEEEALPETRIAEKAYEDTESERESYIEEKELSTKIISQTDADILDTDGQNCDSGELEYEVEAEADIDEVRTEFKYRDSENEVITHEGMQNLVFGFTYVHSP